MKWILCGDPEHHDGGDRKWWSANKRGSTSIRSRFRSIRRSAIARCDASGSLASYTLLNARISIWVEKRRNSTIGQKLEVNYLYSGQLRTSCRTRIVIIFLQQLGFHIETKGSVKFFRWIGNIIRSDPDKLVTAFHRKSRGPGDACARTFLWKRELRFGKWCSKSGVTKTEAQYLYSLTQKIENAKYASEPRRRTCEAVSRAEKSVTWQKQITKFFLEVVNLETITDMQSWYTILPLNGCNLIRAKQKLLRRRKIVHENFWIRHRNQKLLKRTIQWYLANLVKNCHGIIERPLFLSLRNKRNCRTSYTTSKRGNISCIIAIRTGW